MQDKLTAAQNDYAKKTREARTAEEARRQTRTKMTTMRLNSQAATEKNDEAAKKLGFANEMKTKFASEANQKAAQDKQSVADAAKQTAKESEFKLKEVLTVMDERDGKQSKAKLAVKEALKVKELAQEKHDVHKAKQDQMVKPEPPPKIESVAPDGKFNVDPQMMMRKQMAIMGRMMPSKADKKGTDPDMSSASAEVLKGASEQDPRGKVKKNPKLDPKNGKPKP